MSSIGHNGGPLIKRLSDRDFRALVKSLILSRLPAHHKLLSIGVAALADDDGQATLGAEDLKRVCSVSKRDTVFGVKRDIAENGLGIVATVSEPGRPNRYHVMPPRVVASIIDAYHARIDAGSQPIPKRDTSPVHQDGTRDGPKYGTTPIPKIGTSPVHQKGTSPENGDGSNAPSRADSYNNIPTTELVDSSEKLTTVEQVDRKNIRAVEFELKPEPNNPRVRGTSPRQSNATTDTEIAFEKFWSLFPAERRRGKGKARGLFATIVAGRHKVGRATADEIVQAVREGRGIDPSFPPMPETWLNQGRWMDEPSGAELVGPNGKKWGWWSGLEAKLQNLSHDYWRKAIADHKPNGTWPWWIFGPPPGDPGCLVPAELVAEYGYEEIYKGKITHG